jgi:hypothetical protein
VRITDTTDNWIQISQLAVYTADGTNVALRKTTFASSTFGSTTTADKAVDGTISTRPYPQGYNNAGNRLNEYWEVDLGATFTITKIDFYNRGDDWFSRSNGDRLQLLDASRNVLDTKILTAALVQSFTYASTTPGPVTTTTPLTLVCINDFESGGWLLVRRVKAGTVWFEARDNLAGTAVYGSYATETASSSFSIEFASFVNASAEYLLMTGEQHTDCTLLLLCYCNCRCLLLSL